MKDLVRGPAAALARCSPPLLAGGAASAAEEKPLPKDLPPFGQDKPLPVPDDRQVHPANGLTVWLVPRAGCPRADRHPRRARRHGARPEGEEGICDVLAAALKSGTAHRTARQIAEELQAVGGEINTTANDDAIFATVDGLAEGAARCSRSSPTSPATPRSPATRSSWRGPTLCRA